jgi:hypothetical protein
MMRNTLAPHINFEELNGLLGKVIPSNIDMVLEHRNSFLIGEWKRESEKVSVGQQILLKAFAKIPNFTVIIVQGNTDKAMIVNKFWKINHIGKPVLVGNSLNNLKDFIVDWYLSTEFPNK